MRTDPDQSEAAKQPVHFTYQDLLRLPVCVSTFALVLTDTPAVTITF